MAIHRRIRKAARNVLAPGFFIPIGIACYYYRFAGQHHKRGDALVEWQPSASMSTGSPSGGQVGSRDIVSGSSTGTAGGMAQPDMKRSVYYEFDKYDVKPEYGALVESHARWLKANPKAKLVIEGNTDERGSREYNLALGQRRAESVTKMLVLLGAKPEQLEAVSWGEEKPRASGGEESARAENRRADFASR
jgi:peptidoglycan-associated lipoprotein